MDGRRTQELAAVVLEDPALTFEILRLVNAAQDRAPPVLASGPVLTVRRGIAMLGVQRLRRAAQGLRPWPGALTAADATRLERLIERCRHAGRLAQALRPAGYDEESVYLAVLFQNLGRLALASHFPLEYLQVDALSTGQEPTGDETRPGRPSENSACLAVLGVELEAVAASVARPWALGEGMTRLMRRVAPEAPVHAGAPDDEVLRATASCANDAVDALRLPPKERDRALAQIVMHYGAALSLNEQALRRDLVETAALASVRAGPGARP
jgi:non-specific serine/threonine protein kinase